MQPYQLRALSPEEAGKLYDDHMIEDFPEDERPKKAMLVQQVRDGFLRAFMMTDGEKDFAYALGTTYEDAVLFTHLAVFPERRGGGIGSKLMALLHEAYAEARIHIVEVETPTAAPDAETEHLRNRRIAFYERAGYTIVPRLHYVLFGVEMHIMTHTSGIPNPPPPERVVSLMDGIYLPRIPDKERHHYTLIIKEA